MSNEQIIKCVFCKGLGNNPHFKGTCPVCKGKGENKVTGKYMTCDSCRGLGTKRGTTLTCYDCGGIGVIPDTRETFRKAREEIREAQKDLAKERQENPPYHFCQCCGDKVNDSVAIKICFDCFGKVKEMRGYNGI